jgi:signal transduction histidine kinase
MVQELVNNILKHANAKEIKVHSNYTGKVLELTISHDGNGLTQQQFEEMRYNKDGMGLKNIQNRVILLRGKIEFFSKESGYGIRIDIPINTPVK